MQSQQKVVLEFIDNESFTENVFPAFKAMQETINEIRNTKNECQNQQSRFKEWKKEGEIIDAEFREIN